MNGERPYVGDLSENTLDYLWWVAENIDPSDHERGFRRAVEKYRQDHPELSQPKTKVEAASMPIPTPFHRSERPS